MWVVWFTKDFEVKELVVCALIMSSRDVIGGIEWTRGLAGTGKDMEALVEKGIIKKVDERIKILASGELTQSLTIRAHGFSAAALAKIEAAGGTAEVIE